ncbi:MAG: TRAP transporter substrate-binding protein DctP [Tabrizicola sp.]|uniref:TRAP transporter substrate-binding protein DctP n=1 Tax=Tabrizicola sp. TaxID=2005166 RepID=UPI0027342DE3|nr:TRAP transporter substrate-binding protein DctP [Tabrizicola sp.]MDP3264972.1 TRAP transporter substrate-binding protein DctP [Tabrizicola sp.]MDP3647485.1 TRAP transporter substrate-binding protein DctP [Paracoccaceae bacterium]MDZ4065521.1 TRAP transporter substrate-binding protein DctP [Tabrizicola sp.]
MTLRWQHLIPSFTLCLATVAPGIARADCLPDTALIFLIPPEAEAEPEGRAARQFADRANAALAGRHCISLRSHTASADLAAALAAGDASFAALPLATVAEVAPALDVINLPFLFDSPHHALAWAEALPAPSATVDTPAPLGVLLTGTLQMTAPRALSTPTDVTGLAFAVPSASPVSAATAAALGATAVPVDSTAAAFAAALAAGTAQASFATWPVIDFGGLYAAPSVITETNHGVTGAAFLAAPGLIATLSPDDATLLLAVLRQVLHEQTLLAFETDAISRQAITEDGGIVLPLDAAERAAFRATLAPLYAAAAARLGRDAINAAVAANAAARPFE